MNDRRHLVKRSVIGVAGIAVGIFFLWLVLRGITWNEIRAIIARVQVGWLIAAMLAYGLGLCVRVGRWWILLSQLAEIGLRAVGETLVVGYAVNNVLPARLGELFRADHGKRRFGLSRSALLGSILVERTLDGLTVVVILAAGLLLAGSPQRAAQSDLAALWSTSVTGAVLFSGIGALALVSVRMSRDVRLAALLPRFVARRLEYFLEGLGTFRRSTVLEAAGASIMVWGAEGLALWFAVRALGTSLGVGHTLVLIGAASLSTLVPTAPGYLGSYQLVFTFVLALFGLPEALGVTAATVVQVFLFGSVTILGLGLYTLRRADPATVAGTARRAANAAGAAPGDGR